MAADEPEPPPAGEIIKVLGFGDAAVPDVLNCMASADPDFDIECPTLREAVMYANSSAEPSMDTIMLSAGTYTLTTTGADEVFPSCEDLPTPTEQNPPEFTNVPDASIGDLDITESLIIQGAGADLTIVEWGDWGAGPDPALTERVFHVYNPTEDVFAEFHGLQVANGLLLKQYLCEGPDTDVDPLPPEPLPTEWWGIRAGGGIAVGAAANTVLHDPNVTGDENSAGRGGGLPPDDPGGVIKGEYIVTLNEVVILSNWSDGDGGGLYNAGPLTAYRVGLIANHSGTNGGGLYNEGNTLFDTMVIEDNDAEGGGGIFVTGNPGIPVEIHNSTISYNDAIGGGGISGRVVPVRIVNSTISSNSGFDVGGGLYSNGSFELVHVTIAYNRARLVFSSADFGGAGINLFNSGNAGVTMIDTLVAHNTMEPDGGEPSSSNCGCTGGENNCIDGDRNIETLGYNLADDTSCNMNWIGDIENVDAMIGPLADNGGLTETHALLAGSPALGAGIKIADLDFDQRGLPREDPPDIGALEAQTPSMNLIKEIAGYIDADGSGDLSVGDTVNYLYTVQNTGEPDPTGITDLTGVTLTDNMLGALALSDDAGDGIGNIAAGDEETATAAYLVQAEDAGTDIVNEATADSDQTEPVSDTAQISVAAAGSDEPPPDDGGDADAVVTTSSSGGGGGGGCSLQTARPATVDPAFPALLLGALVWLGGRRCRAAR
jgi:hypothetical protein